MTGICIMNFHILKFPALAYDSKGCSRKYPLLGESGPQKRAPASNWDKKPRSSVAGIGPLLVFCSNQQLLGG